MDIKLAILMKDMYMLMRNLKVNHAQTELEDGTIIRCDIKEPKECMNVKMPEVRNDAKV